MQTFLPLPNFRYSLECLDMRRLSKQRLEAVTIYKVLSVGLLSGWAKHPVVSQWKGYTNALADYANIAMDVWIERGYKSSLQKIPLVDGLTDDDPPWLGLPEFHASHRSNLLRKDPAYYGQFGWTEPNDLPYYWPSKHAKQT